LAKRRKIVIFILWLLYPGKTVPCIYSTADCVDPKDSLDSSTDKNPYLYYAHVKYPSDVCMLPDKWNSY